MDAINEVLMPPQVKHLQVISYLVYFMLLLHLPYMGMVLGSSGLSAVYNRWKPDMSKDLIKMSMGNIWVWLGLGVLPAVTLAFLFKAMLFNTTIPIHMFMLRIIALLAVGFLLLTVYRKTGKTLIGFAGVAAIMGYCFHLINFMALLLFPEKWAFLKGPIPFPLFYITPLIQFGGFVLLTLIITGAGILFIYYRWPEKRLAQDVPYYNFLRYHGYGLVLVGSLFMPLVIFWDLYNAPGYSKSISVFVISGLIVIAVFLLLSAVAWMLKHYKNPVPRFSTAVFIIALALFGLVIGKDRTLQANASMDTMEALKMDAEKVRGEEEAKREEIYSKSMVPDEKLGESIYNELCTACHAFDKKIMGPPLNSVLPKYIDKQDALISFIKNPVKVDPAYPAMANPGLSTIKVKSVVKYLMNRFKPQDKPGTENKEVKDETKETPKQENKE